MNFFDRILAKIRFKRAKNHSSSSFVDKLNEFTPPYSLHLGCGNIRIDSFCNVDIIETFATDVLDDIALLNKFPNNTVKEIYACHVLEHFSHNEIVPILKRWFEVLQPGGTLRVSVPDIDRIVKIYSKNMSHFERSGYTPWIGLIYGWQSTPYDYHKTGFNANWLGNLLETSGFVNPREYPHEPHFIPGIVDASLANEPFNEYISLNMLATKPISSFARD